MPDDALPQPVLTPLTDAALILVATVEPGGEDAVRDLLPDLAALGRSVGFRVPVAGLACVTGIGSDLWDRLFTGPRPAGLHPFAPLHGPRHTAPATPGDLFFHVRAQRLDMCFEWGAQVHRRLAGAVRFVDEVQGFRYFDRRDLLGFVDGTENPTGPDAEAAVLVTAADDPGFAGGSYVVAQKYLHDLAAWNALPTEAQELVIGRTKLDDIELPDDAKPSDSHLTLNTIVDADGVQRQIVRDNMPFGSVAEGEFGTYFIGYARTPEVTELMLRRMFLGDPPGNHDRILDFSRALTGGLFFVPSADFLDDPPPAPATHADAADADATGAGAGAGTEAVPVPQRAHADGSLGIGSLRDAPAPAAAPAS